MTVPGTGPLAVLIVDDETDLAEELALGLGANAVCKLVPELRPAFRGRKNH